jgi:hypothetical protein
LALEVRGVRSEELIEFEGKLWLPLEITVPSQGFAEAWRIGAREWRTAGTEARIYPIREAWKTYPPVSVPGAGDRLPDMPDEGEILRRFEAALGKIR